MRAHLLLFARLVRAGFRQRTTYRLAMLAGVLANSVFGAIRGAILAATITASGGTLAGYTGSSLSTYNWLTQGLLGPLSLWGSTEVSERVRTGDIAIDLARPLDLQLGHLAQDLGRALASVLPRTIPTVLIGALTFGIALPATPLPWLLGLLSISFALVLSYLARFVLQVTSFWLVDARGLQTLYMVASGFFAGLVVPIHIMPSWLQTLAYATPFPAMMQFPVDILSGYVAGPDAGGRLLAQVGWLAVLFVLGRVMLRAGQRRLVVQGG